VLEVVDPGLLLTVQDGGRPGLAHVGVPRSGACDPWGLATANLLVGAAPDAPALEVTLGGCVLRVAATAAIALGGADLGAELDDGRPLRPGVAHRVRRGALIRFAGGDRGVRAYVALAGGIAIDPILGAAASYGPGRLGFAGGRPLQAGDRVGPRRATDLGPVGQTWPAELAPHPMLETGPLAFVPGPDLDAVPPGALAAFAAAAWRVGVASDRMGIRLEGAALGRGTEIVSHPLVAGAVQLPPNGLPIVLLPDGPTIGGYPVLGVVAAADAARLGQLRPGDDARFVTIDAATARARGRDRAERLARAAGMLRADAVWHALVDHAGG
jgi:biotin-dependent carboxylase-like uncharacterized protein